MKQSLLLVLVSSLLLCATTLHAQKGPMVNFEGHWQGNANWGMVKYTMSLDIEQDGNKIWGVALTENIKNDQFIKYEIIGDIANDGIFVRGIKLIEKKGIGMCMPAYTIALEEGNHNKIIGDWKGNNGANSCWIPGAGGFNLTRSEQLSAEVATRVATIASDDNRGKALRGELQRQKYYALIIGVQDYEDESIVDLNQPISDAKLLKDELVAEYSFNPEDVLFLENPDRSTIIETFDLLTTKVKSTDNFLIFYAGHGIWDEQIEQGYWLPSDAKKTSKAAWLSNGTIRDYIRAIDSKHTLLITDACFSGGILKTREAFTASKAMLEMYKLPSRKAMTSGALKTVPDKSVFIEYLIKALKYNDQPMISADQLFTGFKYNVINNSPNGQVPQYGVIAQADDEGGDFIFLRK